MKSIYLTLIILFGGYYLQAQCVSSDVFDVDDANAYCFEVSDNVRYIYANNYPDHSDNYNQPQFTMVAGDYEYYMCAYPEEASDFTPLYEETETSVGCTYNYEFGVSINGVRYDPNSAVTFENDDGSNNIDWHVEATSSSNTIGQNMGTDNGGHLNASGEYHYHAVPYDYFTSDLGIDGSEHSPLVGYAADGFPIYYKYVYSDSEDSLSSITEASSGYTLKSGDRDGDGLTAPDGSYDGNYYEDYEYSSASTILDECNGRWGVTPDFPYGTYYYVLTDEYPYIPRCFKGTHVDNSFRVGPTASCSISSSTTSSSCASEVSGCMDPFSDNYNSSATVDDGSCSYSTITWSGSWSNTSGPGDANHVTISSNYTFSTDGKFSCDNLTIGSGATVTVDTEEALVVYGDVTNNGTLVIESGGSLITYDGTTFSGNDVTIKRSTRYSDGKYSFVGTPVNQNSSITGADVGSVVYKYNETTAYSGDQGLSRWEDASSDQLVPGQGYAQAFQQDLTFTGTPNNGTITVTGTFTDRTNDNVEGWVLVANPYPAAISASRFLNENDNLTGAIYFWDDNNSQSARGSNSDYVVANGFATTQSSQAGNEDRYNYHIGAGQGFFVKLSGDTDLEVTFTEAMRVSDSNSDDNYFRTSGASTPLLRINLMDAEGLFKQTVIGFVEGVSKYELNRKYDAPSINSEQDQAIYSLKSDVALAIHATENDFESISLGINLLESGTYQIAMSQEHVDASVMLLDQLTGDYVDLSEPYEFTAVAGKIRDRFVLVSTSRVLGTNGVVKNMIYAAENTLYISYVGTDSKSIEIYDLTGHLELTRKVTSDATIDLSGFAKGIYVVTDGTTKKKIVVR